MVVAKLRHSEWLGGKESMAPFSTRKEETDDDDNDTTAKILISITLN